VATLTTSALGGGSHHITASYLGDGGYVASDSGAVDHLVGVQSSPGGTVAATLSLTLGAPASFGAFTPGVDKTYTASTTANVISTAGDATLSVSDPGHLTNGSFSLPDALQVTLTPSSWSAPVSNAAVAIAFSQHIGTSDALRTGTYSKTLTFTLSTTTP
jgi:X-Pro dipeptidyl-peptidase